MKGKIIVASQKLIFKQIHLGQAFSYYSKWQGMLYGWCEFTIIDPNGGASHCIKISLENSPPHPQ